MFMQCKKGLQVAGFMVLVWSGAVAQAAMPAQEFACEVRAEGGRLGMVLVQADDMKLAKHSAVGAVAKTMDGIDSVATAVIECIVSPQGKFRDFQFQQFYESTPR